jgi:hypothetical protein
VEFEICDASNAAFVLLFGLFGFALIRAPSFALLKSQAEVSN